MIALRVSSDLDKMAKGLEAQQARVLRAIAQGLQDGGNLTRTQVRKAMRAQTGLLRLKSVTSRERTINPYVSGLAPKSGVGPVRGPSLSYTIVYRGKPPTKPAEFKTTVKTGRGGGVTVWMWAVAHKFQRSFQQKFKGGLRMRIAGARLPIRSFKGPNLAKEAVKDDVASTFLTKSVALVPAAIERRLARAL